jgi:TetR/AcrR family transcriptional regulator, transcriptional repressor for nem operon
LWTAADNGEIAVFIIRIVVAVVKRRLFQHDETMAGVKQFDRNQVLDRAMALFWRRGYEATSIQDLVEATGINRGSIYATFGDKKGLFLAVLDHYGEKVGKPLMAELADPDPRRAIERMLDSIIRRTSDPRFPRGCLNTNTSVECPASGDEIARKITEGFGQQESAIYGVLRRAQAEGSLAATLDPRALARFFMGVAHGLNVVSKAVADPGVLKDVARIAMSVWDEAKGPRRQGSRSRRRSQTRSLG